MGWNQIRWTEAHQVASLMDVDPGDMPDPGVTPEAHFRELLDANERSSAVRFLGHALPRLEALAWSARFLEEEARERELPREDRQALDFALRWLGDPSDSSRRAAKEAADAAGERSPERMLAYGVFFSGGSISAPDMPPIPPEPYIAGRFAAGAVAIAALRADDHKAAFDRALALGDQVASDGMKALEAA